jgi:pyruvate/2-oxoglutarate dehydrogenase complex dihydrolipoamide acyltransferase (E2) component
MSSGRVAFTQTDWPQIRNALKAFLDHKRPNVINAAVEVDVTDGLAAIRRIEHELRVAVSFHAWVTWCVVQAAVAHPIVHTYRHGNKLITFDDIDILSPIDKRLPSGVRIPVGHIIRGAQKKSLAQINHEIRQAVRATDLSDDRAVKMRRTFAALPRPARGLIAWLTVRNPHRFRITHGTLLVTNIRSHGFTNPFHAVTPTVHTVSVAVGNTIERLKLDRGQVVSRTMLCLSGAADHDIVDGMGGARFCYRLISLLESAAGLDEHFVRETRALMSERRSNASA